MTERDDNVFQDTAADLPYQPVYVTKDGLRRQAFGVRGTDFSFSAKAGDEVQRLDTLRDAISQFFATHRLTFERVSQNIQKLQDGLGYLPGGKDEARKHVDPAFFDRLAALRDKLMHVLVNYVNYMRDVETQRPTDGSSLSNELKILSQQANKSLHDSIEMLEESLNTFATGPSAPDDCFRELEAIYQGHQTDHKYSVDRLKRHCPTHIAESLDTLNRFMESEARSQFLANGARLRELVIAPMRGLAADLQLLDQAVEQLGNLNVTAKCIRAGGEDARIAALKLTTEQLRIIHESVKPRIESE